jgi:type I restriction enzyme R subunit
MNDIAASVRARLLNVAKAQGVDFNQVLVRFALERILRKYGYPPDLQDAAVQTVLQQAEALSSGWSVSHRGTT